jgi:phosphoribosylaminoimidazolecarboxamide formyltransferase/IMP cyclohydrolase
MAELAENGTVAAGEVVVSRALVSVSDKTGVVEFATGLAALGIEIVSTGGTAKTLREAGLEVRSVSELTGFPEIMDGRVKTLHPLIHGSLLARRDDPAHMAAAAEHGVQWIDLVCVNLYPFEDVSSRDGVSFGEVIENIDIGGPTMIRATAKNHAFVAPVVNPQSYGAVLEALRNGGKIPLELRQSLAGEAFARTAAYDAAIASWFSVQSPGTPADQTATSVDRPDRILRSWEIASALSYGENPHQSAAYYAQTGRDDDLLSRFVKLSGKDLSYNNLLDLDAVRRIVDEFDEPACVIVKHNNPCGVAVGPDAITAYRSAFNCDPTSAFGGVLAFNREIDAELATALMGQFIEVLAAPSFSAEALEIMSAKPNIRILRDSSPGAGQTEPEIRQVLGGILVQDRDQGQNRSDGMKVVSKRQPTEQEWEDMLFAWTVARHVKSNAIVFAKGGATLGIGAGQMSRVDSARIAVSKAPVSLEGSSVASDAFFPFADGPQEAIDAGASCVIQPGGSIRDEEVIEACDEAGVVLVMTGRRHFRH